jgi:ketosteroid isomerase-like protein
MAIMRILSILIALFALASVALCQAKPKVPKEIASAYQTQLKDLRAGNWSGFFSYFDPSSSYVKADGKTETLDQFKADVAEMTKGSTKLTAVLKYTGAVVTGNTADISYEFTLGVKRKGSKVEHMKEIATDTWKKMSGGWKLVKTVDKPTG